MCFEVCTLYGWDRIYTVPVVLSYTLHKIKSYSIFRANFTCTYQLAELCTLSRLESLAMWIYYYYILNCAIESSYLFDYWDVPKFHKQKLPMVLRCNPKKDGVWSSTYSITNEDEKILITARLGTHNCHFKLLLLLKTDVYIHSLLHSSHSLYIRQIFFDGEYWNS